MRLGDYDVVIVGAGLAGVTISNELSRLGFSVLLLEKGEQPDTYSDDQYYTQNKSNLLFTRGMGVGGTSNFWHSGFLRISKNVEWVGAILDDHWYARAKEYLNIPDEACVSPSEIFYPNKRYVAVPHNSVKLLRGVGDIEIISEGDYVNFLHDSQSCSVGYKRLVICAGGIGTPLLLKSELNRRRFNSEHIGKNFTDHISGVVLKIKLRNIEFKSFAKKCGNGVLKNGIAIKDDVVGLDHIFFPRPALGLKSPPHTQIFRREIVGLFGTKKYVRAIILLITHVDLLLETLLYKSSLMFPCKYIQYNVVSEQVEMNSNSISYSDTGKPVIRWEISDVETLAINNAVDKLILEMTEKIDEYKKFQLTADTYTMCCHHSGTMRMSYGGQLGVVGADCELIGFKNIFVCDGSVLPKTSYVNTGLTIVALALRLSKHLAKQLAAR